MQTSCASFAGFPLPAQKRGVHAIDKPDGHAMDGVKGHNAAMTICTSRGSTLFAARQGRSMLHEGGTGHTTRSPMRINTVRLG
mmetsp:Transcript_77589/g.130216  ORF Transcript_77589/g.130216 Transcript_77589/m.130216 type:complete len:83 (-) Transcript_77589:80-328(-)|eukprot:CAMPEP_0174313398 /NCGR_PEP_ID=MMETSP0810-20121108/4945_1 /TAXON_ID=73025 ORGANISM="Eutreptiella gymnastica-like, Strain CCMP1594" /NCGR_SAMPLE_ID=MMETSP0810 /ASSEMBLY_ACC=CAM_ASM_000659 /LENGTH=82 /DNA_ID=CAMNT_0015422141 /DNA_START=850 /DNA_END=1098 /DNA_ORIENTATION=-